MGGSGLDPTTNFYDYYEAATNIYESLVDYTNQLKAVSNQVITLENQNTSLSNSIESTAINWDVIIDNLDAELLLLEDDVGVLSNRVISTIHELEPDIQVIGTSNGYIAINMDLRSSGDLNNWQTILSKEHAIPTTNGVEYFRINTGSAKGQ